MADGTRDGKGRYTRTLTTAARDAEAAALRARGRTFQQIADELGFASRAKAYEAVQRAFAAIPSEQVEEARRLDLERLDRLIEYHSAIMEREHVTVSHGRVITREAGVERDKDGIERLDMDGKPIPVAEDVLDDGPGQASAREVRALIERRAKIIGYEAPARTRIEVITEDAVEAEMAELARKIALNDARQARPADTGAA